MAKRKFKLPGIHELNKEQEEVRSLPLDGQHLIIGGPGTGKSVVALLRIKKHIAANSDYQFLVYNQLLKHACEQLLEDTFNNQTWNSWFSRIYYKLTNTVLPTLPANNARWKEIDWTAIAENLSIIEIKETEQKYLVIDEGQDMPPSFYNTLTNLGFENFFVVADQNQQIINGHNSSRLDIMDALSIDDDNVIELKTNFRNSLAVAKLAQHFYTGDPASPPPELPVSRSKSQVRPLLFEYTENQFQKIINRILKNADRNPNKLTGIITPSNNVRSRYYNALVNTNIDLDNEKPKISTYASGLNIDINFDEGGIIVINAQSCKGLEFDVVIIADIDEFHLGQKNLAAKKRLFYVIIARAIEQVIMLKQHGKNCPIEAILPQDDSILSRKGHTTKSA